MSIGQLVSLYKKYTPKQWYRPPFMNKSAKTLDGYYFSYLSRPFVCECCDEIPKNVNVFEVYKKYKSGQSTDMVWCIRCSQMMHRAHLPSFAIHKMKQDGVYCCWSCIFGTISSTVIIYYDMMDGTLTVPPKYQYVAFSFSVSIYLFLCI